MDKNLALVYQKKIERTVKALNKNGFDAHFIPTLDGLFKKIDELLKPGDSCSVGGSMTLFETGIVDYLKSGKYRYYDRYAEGADTGEVFHKALGCDVYFMSSNAISEDGYLVNLEGRGNRLAALLYGPEKVIVVAGRNKIAKDLQAAYRRARDFASPANVLRLGLKTPCAETGSCVDCKSENRACCHELASGMQMVKGRVAVLILPESYGY